MSAAAELYRRAVELGLSLEAKGDKLAVRPADRCPPDFVETLRTHKQEILAMLEADNIELAPDCRPWEHVAKQILAGEFVGADRSTRQSLIVGLRDTPHPTCQRALNLLKQHETTP